jgi:hypothetical protein
MAEQAASPRTVPTADRNGRNPFGVRNASDSCQEIIAAIARARPYFRPITKDAVNPHFQRSYESLNEVLDGVRAALADQGVEILQPTIFTRAGLFVRTIAYHIPTGQWIAAEFPALGEDNQRVGAGISYGRRYGLKALLCLEVTDDDDGHASCSRDSGGAYGRQDPSRRNGTSGGRKQVQGNGSGGGYGRPKTGKGLYAYAKAMQEKRDIDALNFLHWYGRQHGLPEKIGEWPDAAIGKATQELNAWADSPDELR